MKTELKKLGLTNDEVTVYLACLETNGGPVSVIARKAGVQRVGCYHTIEKLLKKKLLSQYNKNGVKCYAPEAPEKLEEIALEKVHIAKSILPQLKSLVSTSSFRPRIRFYEGLDGVERVFNESLTADSEILAYTNFKQVLTEIPVFFKDYTAKRLKKGVKSRYLSPNTIENVQSIDEVLPKQFDSNLLEVLLVNKDQFPFENDILIFENSVGIVSLNPDERLGLIVESPTLSKTMKAIYDLAWLGATAFVAK